jgi:hypothetical protein
MSNPQSEEYLAARIESCRLLGLNPDDLTAHEAIRADIATVLRLWLDNSQSALLGGGTADAGKLLSVAEALTKFIPEPEHKSRREDPRQHMWRTYLEARRRGALAGEGYDGLKLENERLKAELATLKAAASPAPGEPSATPPAPAGGNVVTLSRPTNERTTERSEVSPNPSAASNVPVLVECVCDPSPEEPWKAYVEPDGSIRSTPFHGGKYWGPV